MHPSCNQRALLLGTLLILTLSMSQQAEVKPACSINKDLNNTKIFTTKNEKYPYYLNNFFSGYNLRYELQNGDFVISHNIYPGYEVVKKYQTTNLQKQQIAISNYENQDGSISMLVLTLNEQAGFKQYYVNYGNSYAISIPDFDLKITLPDTTQQCYDIDVIDESTAIVSCIDELETSGPNDQNFQTMLYVVTYRDKPFVKQYQFPGKFILQEMPENQKVRIYRSFDADKKTPLTYAAVSVLFEDDSANDFSKTYIDMFLIDSNYALTQMSAIGAAELKIPLLQVADFTVMDERLFILDNTFGIYNVLYQNGVTEVDSIEIKQGTKNWAIDVVDIEEEYYIQVLTTNTLLEIKENTLSSYEYDILFNVPLEFEVTNYAEIQANDEYIGLLIGRLLFIFERQKKGLLKFTLSNVGEYELLFQDDLFVMNSTYVINYWLHQPYLQVVPYEDRDVEYSITLQAVSQTLYDTKTCQITIRSILLSNPNDKSLANTTRQAGPEYQKDCNSDWPVLYPLGDDYVGPNIGYETRLIGLLDEAENSIPLTDDNEIILGIDMPALAKVSIGARDWSQFILTQVEHYEEHSFYLLLQHENFTAFSYDCEVDEYNHTQVECELIGQRDLDNSIQTWDVCVFKGVTLWTYIDFHDVIYFYDFNFNEFMKIDEYTKDYDVLDIEVYDEMLLIMYDTKDPHDEPNQVIDFRVFDTGFKLMYKINKNTVAKWPGYQFWNPKKLLHSDDYPDMLIVQSETVVDKVPYISLFGMYVEDKGVGYIFNVPNQENCEVFLVGYSLFIFYRSLHEVKEYNIINMNRLNLLKSMPTYTYTPRSVFLSQSGLLYIMAELNGKAYMMIYRSNTPLINSLYSVVPLNIQPTELEDLTFHVDGIRMDTCVILNQDQFLVYRVPDRPHMVVQTNFRNDRYVKFFTFSLIIRSWDELDDPIILQHQIRAVNKQQRIRMNHDIIANSTFMKTVSIPNKADGELYTIDDEDWVQGSVFNYYLQCNDCGTKIQFRNRVEMTMDHIGGISQAKDVLTDVANKNVIVLTSDQLLFIKYDMKSVETVNLNIDKSKNLCDSLYPLYNSAQTQIESVLVFCLIVDALKQPVNYMFITVNVKNHQTIKPIEIKEVQQMGKAQIVDKYLFVNDIFDEEDEEEYGAIYVYEVKFTNRQLTLLQVLNSDYFQQDEPFEVKSFETLPIIETNKIRLMVADLYMQLIIADIPMDASFNLDFDNKILRVLDLRSDLYFKELYVTDSSQLYETYTIDYKRSQTTSGDVFDTYYTLVLINDTAIYEVMLTLENDDLELDISTNIYQAFNDYGDYPTQKVIKGLGFVSTAVYYNDEKNQSIFAFYERTSDQVRGNLLINPIVGAHKFSYNMSFEQIYKYDLYKDENNLTHAIVVNPYDQSVARLTYYKKMQMNITSATIQKQQIYLMAISDFQEPTDLFKFTLDYKRKPQPPKPGKPHHLWWISLVVVGVLVIAGIIAFFYIKNRRRRRNKESDMISLQEGINPVTSESK